MAAKLFGATLRQIAARDDGDGSAGGAPLIVVDALDVLLQKELPAAALVKPARAAAVADLRLEYESGGFASSGVHAPEAWMAMLRAFLRELAEPVVPAESVRALLVAGTDGDALGAAVGALAGERRRVLLHVVGFMKAMGERVDADARGAEIGRLATAFAPCLLHSGEEAVTSQRAQSEHALLLALVQHLELPLDELELDRGVAAGRRAQHEMRQKRAMAAHPDLRDIIEGAAAPPSLRERALAALRQGLEPLAFDLYAAGNWMPATYALDQQLGDRQRRAFTAAMACILTAGLNRVSPEAPSVLLQNECELLRLALLTDQSQAAREALLADAVSAGASLADELHKQRFLAGVPGRPDGVRLNPAEQRRQAAVLTTLEKQPPYFAVLRVSRLRAANVIPVGGWDTGVRPQVCVVARALGPEVDPETAVVWSKPARVDTDSGDVIFDSDGENELVLNLEAEPVRKPPSLLRLLWTRGFGRESS